jgi:acetolactate synthase I/II/III large subunit
MSEEITGHGGDHMVAAALDHGVTTMWTLSGAHIFPLLDAAVGGLAGAENGDGPLRLIDVRHEQTAAFAAEATGKLTRTPGLTTVTAGPGVTNVVSAVTSAWFNASPMVVIGGRAPDERWGSGALQELDQPPIFSTITKSAHTIHDANSLYAETEAAFTAARTPHRGPVFLDVPMDVLFTDASSGRKRSVITKNEVDDAAITAAAQLLSSANAPLLIIGGDVWADGAEEAALEFVRSTNMPVIANGMARGVIPPSEPMLITGARSAAIKEADVVFVVGAPLDFRLGYGVFRGKLIHVVDAPSAIATHANPDVRVTGDIGDVFRLLTEKVQGHWNDWSARLSDLHQANRAKDQAMLTSESELIHPARIYGELLRQLDDDAVIIGDGGDFVSFAGRFVEPKKPGRWLDPGPYGCLGTGLGYTMAARVAHPSSQVVLLLGDGAAGFSLMDVDSLVRHNLPAVMIVGNNGVWALEKGPMQSLFGYDVAADLRPATRYDEVVKALGGAGEIVTRPSDLAPAIARAFSSGVPYLVNVITDPDAAYPRATTGI